MSDECLSCSEALEHGDTVIDVGGGSVHKRCYRVPSVRSVGGGVFARIGLRVGELVESKQLQYGDSARKSAEIMRILYPEGLKPHHFTDALITVRILDKLSRIAQRGEGGQDLGGESPYGDIAGYGILGVAKDEAK